MRTYIVATVMDGRFMPVFETSDDDEAAVAREAAQRASQYDTVILYYNIDDEKYDQVLARLGAISE